MKRIYLNEQKYLYNLESEEEQFITYLKRIVKRLKEDNMREKTVDSLFYYVLAKLYLAIINKSQNNFKLIFKVREAKLRFKNYQHLYFLNIKLFYDFLQNDINKNGNVDFYQMNFSYYQLYEQINECIEHFEHFVDKESSNTPQDYFDFSSYFSKYNSKAIKHFLILNKEKNDEYQKVMLRIVIETLQNKPIKELNSADLLIKDDLFNQEEILEKEYQNDNMIKLKFNLQLNECIIIKIGKGLNYGYQKDFFSLFPKKYRSIASSHFYLQIKKELETFETQDNNIKNDNAQKFHFFIRTEKDDYREFHLIYKLYPDTESDIVYLDGRYQLSHDGFLITEKYHQTERIILISNNISKILFFDQSYLHLLIKYQYNLTFDMLADSIDSFFSNKNILTTMLKQIKEINNICSSDDLMVLSALTTYLQKTKRDSFSKIKFELKHSITEENSTTYKIYRVIKQISETGQEKYVNNLTTTIIPVNNSFIQNQIKAEQEKEAQNYINTNFDSQSVSSSNSKKSYDSGKNTFGLKRKNEKKKSHMVNYIILLFSIFIIIISIIFLILENSYNEALSSNIDIYQLEIQLNRVILNSMISFYSLLCFNNGLSNEKGCTNRLENYFNRLGLIELEEFIMKELLLKFDTIQTRWNSYQQKSSNLKNKNLEQMLTKESRSYHLKCVNGRFIDDSSVSSFQETLTVFVNKITMISLNKQFQNITIYPIYINESFAPLETIDKSIELSRDQLEIYEVLFSFYDYSIHLMAIQESIKNEANNTISYNLISIIIFIAGLIFLNALVAIVFFCLFNRNTKLIETMLLKMDTMFQIEFNIKRLNSKVSILKDLIRLYKESPIILVNKIKETFKKESTKKQKTIQEIPTTKVYDLSFIMRIYKKRVLLLELFFVVYCIIFVVIFIVNFDKITICVNIMEHSGLTEELTYLSIASMQMMEFSNITEKSLSQKLFPESQTAYQDPNQKLNLQGRYFENLINVFEYYKLREEIEKGNLEQIYNETNTYFKYDCNTIMTVLNDSRVNRLIKSNPEYSPMLTSFCNKIDVLKLSDEHLFLNEIIYGNMKLIGNAEDHFINHINPPKNETQLFFLVSEVILIYRPLRAYISGFYYGNIPNIILQNHFIFLLIFLIGNIVIKVFDFIILKFSIIDKIGSDIRNLKNLQLSLLCS